MSKRRTFIGLALLAGGAVVAGAGYRVWRGNRAPGGHADAVPDDICLVAPTFAYDAASGLPPQAAREVPPDARCPVCGMFPARNRRWAAQAIFTNGDVQYLDSPLNLFLYLQNVPRYTPGQQDTDIVALYVTDLDTGEWIPAEQAMYVHGSQLMGPMRSGNLPAFGSQERARAFIALQGGEIHTMERLRRELPPSLRQLAPHTHDAAAHTH